MSGLRRVSFKYRSGPAALRSLSDGTAYFAKPSELNDALEAQFEPSPSSQFSTTLAATLTELAKSRGEALGFAPDESFAAKFDEHVTREDEHFKEACQRLGLFSSARRPDSQPMWAYYCDHSKGFCFELEWSDELLTAYQLMPTVIQYSDEPRIHNRADDLRLALLALGEEHPDWTVDAIQKHSFTESFNRNWMARSMGRAVSTKHADWRHESELRMISPAAGPLPILKNLLKRIYFVRTDFPEWGPTMMLLHQLYPNVEVSQIQFSHRAPLVSIIPMVEKLVPL